MGVCITICLDKEIPEADMDCDGKTLADCGQSLDEIAKEHGIKPAFSTFVLDPESTAEDLPEGEMIEETWYDSQEGLRVVSELISVIEAPDGKSKKFIEKRGGVLSPLWRAMGLSSKSGMEGKWAEELLFELKELERCLQLAVEHQARFFLLAM